MNQRFIIITMESLLLLVALWSPVPWGNWLVLQLAVIPLLLRERQVVPILISSLIIALGYWIGLPSTDPFQHQAGVVFLCVGIGGLLGWFPLPRTNLSQRRDHGCTDEIATFLIPVSIAAIFIYRSILHLTWSEQDLAILAVISLLSLALCGVRLMGPLAMSQRLRLSVLTILSNANIAAILMGWVKLYPERTWANTSNIPSAENLFYAILTVESLAVVVLALCLQRVVGANQSKDREAALVAEMATHPWIKKLVLICSLSLAGLPFLPGAIWRFLLLAALILPQSRSNVTHLAEPHHGFIALAIAFSVATIIVSLGQVRMFQILMSSRPETEEVVTVSPS